MLTTFALAVTIATVAIPFLPYGNTDHAGRPSVARCVTFKLLIGATIAVWVAVLLS